MENVETNWLGTETAPTVQGYESPLAKRIRMLETDIINDSEHGRESEETREASHRVINSVSTTNARSGIRHASSLNQQTTINQMRLKLKNKTAAHQRPRTADSSTQEKHARSARGRRPKSSRALKRHTASVEVETKTIGAQLRKRGETSHSTSMPLLPATTGHAFHKLDNNKLSRTIGKENSLDI